MESIRACLYGKQGSVIPNIQTDRHIYKSVYVTWMGQKKLKPVAPFHFTKRYL